MGVRHPPTFDTMKMKNTTWCAVMRYLFIRSHGRISSIEAPGGAQQIGDDRADEQEDHVGQRRGLALDVDVDAAGHDEQRADQRDEADVLLRGVQNGGGGRLGQDEQVIAQRDQRQSDGHLGIVAAPPVGEEQRAPRRSRAAAIRTAASSKGWRHRHGA